MDADIRDSSAYRVTEAWFRAALEPGFGRPMAAHDLDVTADGSRTVYAAPVMTSLEAPAQMRVYATDLASGATTAITEGPGDDRLPRWSPDGAMVAFLSDRGQPGRFALHVLVDGVVRAAGVVEGSVEWLEWSPDGAEILLGVAGAEAEQAGSLGARGPATAEDRPAWLPDVRSTEEKDRWRRVWRHDVETATSVPVTSAGITVWEAVWAAPDQLLAVVSDDPHEAAWYSARLALIDVEGVATTLYEPRRQVGWPAASPSGDRYAVVEAVSSDRIIVAGDVLLLDAGATPRLVPTAGVDVSRLRWLDQRTLFFVGLRGLDVVVGSVDVDSGAVEEWWCGEEGTGHSNPDALPVGPRTALLSADSSTRPPELATVGPDGLRTVTSFGSTGSGAVGAALRVEGITWASRDGQEVQGLLVLPTSGTAPYPTILVIHGGPVSAARSRWSTGLLPLLASRGYAALMPNPRGSSGRGQAYAEAVVGDLGGGESDDLLSGLDALVDRGIADPTRLGVQGGSHGGFMASWLVTRTERFAAAVAAVPITDWTSTYWTSNIAAFCTIFLGGTAEEIPEVYRERSPTTHAARVSTPTFLWAGADDHCCPPSQAVEMFQALQEHGVPSALAIYPGEGHGVRQFPALLDVTARMLAWYEQWMPA